MGEAALPGHVEQAAGSHKGDFVKTSICVFCGSRTGNAPIFRDRATDLGRLIAQRGHGLVYGAGQIGLMGVVADAALDAGGHVVGVIPGSLVERELAHDRLSELRVVPSMHARKAMMAELSSAFIALPGGLGTFEELCEILTWAQLRFHTKPIGLLNVDGYFDPLIAMLDRAVADGFMSDSNRQLLRVETEPLALLEHLERQMHPETKSTDVLHERT